MAFFNEALIDEIKAANDIVDIVSEYVTLRRTGTSYKGLCPFHKEKTPSFSVSADKQIFHCFGCGVGGDVIKFLMQNVQNLRSQQLPVFVFHSDTVWRNPSSVVITLE